MTSIRWKTIEAKTSATYDAAYIGDVKVARTIPSPKGAMTTAFGVSVFLPVAYDSAKHFAREPDAKLYIEEKLMEFLRRAGLDRTFDRRTA